MPFSSAALSRPEPFAARTVGLDYFAARAGVAGRHPRWILAFAKTLIAEAGLPAPIGGYGNAAITPDARWTRTALDNWFARGTCSPIHLASSAGSRFGAADRSLAAAPFDPRGGAARALLLQSNTLEQSS